MADTMAVSQRTLRTETWVVERGRRKEEGVPVCQCVSVSVL